MYLIFDGYLIYSFGISNINFYFFVKIDDTCMYSFTNSESFYKITYKRISDLICMIIHNLR